MHRDIVTAAKVENGRVLVSASVKCPTGGYSLSLDVKRYDNVLVCTVMLASPFPGEMVTQAITNLELDETVEIPEGISDVHVFVEPQRDPSFSFKT